MKKILPIIILMLFCSNIGLAEEVANKITPTSSAPIKAIENTQANVSADVKSAANINVNSNPSTFTDDSEDNNLELRGFAEYEEEPQEIFLEDQGETTQNTIYMKTPSSQNSLKLKAPERVGTKSLLTNAIKQAPAPMLNRLDAASKFSSQEYNINPVSSSYSGKAGNMTFGTTYDSSISSSRLNYTTGFFTRYDGKRFAVTSAFSKSTNDGYDSYNDRLYVAPELKLTKRLSLLDVMQSDITQTNRDNEVILRYRPKIGSHSDDIQFEVGAAQSFNENQYVDSSVRFSTRFKL